MLGFFSAPAPPTLDQVLKTAASYQSSNDSALSNFVAIEQYDQRSTLKATDKSAAETNQRHITSVILMIRDGNVWFPSRCAGSSNGVGSEKPDYRYLQTVAALGPRPDARAFRRTLNLPTVPLSVLRDPVARTFSAKKLGEELVNGQRAWKVLFERKAADRESTAVTLWIQPDTGQVLQSSVDVVAIGLTGPAVFDGRFHTRLTALYGFNERFGVMLPVSMQEELDDASQFIEGRAEYSYSRSPDAGSPPPSNTRAADSSAEYKLAVDVPLVSVDVTVNGESGAITDLKESDFDVYENGVRQSLTAFSPATVPYNVLLLFDWSDSTADKRTFIEKAAYGFVDLLRPSDWVGIGRFAGNVHMEGWTSIGREAAQRVSQLKEPLSTSTTNLYTSIEQALTNEHLPFIGRRRAMVVLTDGVDSGLEERLKKSAATANPEGERREASRFNRLLAIVRQERVPVYIVAINTFDESVPANFTPKLQAYQNNFHSAVNDRLQQVAQASGGRVVYANTYDDVTPLYKQLSKELGTAYTLGYYSNLSDGSTTRKIEVRAKREGMNVLQSRTTYTLP